MMLCPLRLDIDPLDASPPPVEMEILKANLSIDFSDLDDLIALNLSAAVLEFEASTHRTVMRRSHRWVLQDFSSDAYQAIRLPRGKTRAVASIAYVAGGTTHTLTSGDWQEDLSGDDGGVLMPPRGGSWPSPDYDCPAPVMITFEAGWSAAEMPADIKRAIMFRVRASIDDERGTVGASTLAGSMATFEALVSGWRLTRWY